MKHWLLLALVLSPLSIAGTGCSHDHDDLDDDGGVTRTEKKTTYRRDGDVDDHKKVTTEKKTTVYDRD